jgi:hypothetical protein
MDLWLKVNITLSTNPSLNCKQLIFNTLRRVFMFTFKICEYEIEKHADAYFSFFNGVSGKKSLGEQLKTLANSFK